MSVRTYNPSVRVGNWNEDIQLEEDQVKDFLEKRESGELLSQKTSNLMTTLCKKVELSISRDRNVHFGDVVMIKCPEAANASKFANMDARPLCALSLNLTDPFKALQSKKVEGNCGVSGSKFTEPNMRNAFIITSVDGTPNGTTLKYGEEFLLQTQEGEAGSLLLQSDMKTFLKCSKKSRHQEVNLVNQQSYLTHWKVEHFNPLIRMEFEGAPVPANEPVVIVHCKTNQALAVEKNHSLSNQFGREFEISAHTYLDSHKAEMDVNHWMFVMGVPGHDVYPVVPQK